MQAGVLELGRVKFASGDKANNHLSIERLFEHPLQLETILHRLGDVALRFEPDLLVGVPTGGEKLAERLSDAKYVGVPIAHLVKVENQPGKKTFGYRTPDDLDLVMSADRLVVVEDFFNKLTSTRGVLEVPGIAERAQAAVGVWDRGFHPSRDTLPIPVEALVTEYIPKFLRQAEELYSLGVPRMEEN